MDPREHEAMYEFIKEFWTYMKSHWVPEDTDEWFDELVTTANAMIDKYEGVSEDVFQVTKRLLVAFLQAQDEKMKFMRTEKKSA